MSNDSDTQASEASTGSSALDARWRERSDRLDSHPSFRQIQGEYGVSYVGSLAGTDKGVEQRAATPHSDRGLQSSGNELNEYISPKGPARSRVGAAVALFQSGQIDQALSAMTDLVTEYPHEALLWNIRGNIYASDSQSELAIADFEQALLEDSGFSEAHYNLGLAFNNLDQWERAVASYERALEIRPDFAEAHFGLGNTFRDLERLNDAVDCYKSALKYRPMFPDAYNNLGVIFELLNKVDDASASYTNAGVQNSELKNLDAALINFAHVLQINPTFSDAHFNIGAIQTRLGMVGQASKSLKHALELNPENQMASHIFNALSGNHVDSVPRGYVESLFDSYAENFERKLVSDLEYRTPSELKAAYLKLDFGRKKLDKAVDLGCGTGLAGKVFRDMVSGMYGIDLSPKMIEKAREKDIYDRLIADDLISGLELFETQFDLFLAADVFVYVGDLNPVLLAIAQSANRGAALVFSTEDESGDGYSLQKTGRFSHSYNYVTRVTASLGFRLEHFEQANLRKEKGEWLVGGLYVLRIP